MNPITNAKSMVLKPRLSEKAYKESQARTTYVFDVPMIANKATIADAVNTQFEVTVQNVSIIVVKGKMKRSYRKGGKPSIGKRANVKKAYVRLTEGDVINIFGQPEEETKAKADKKADKKSTKKVEDK